MHDPKELAKKYIPRHFKHKNFSSFVRQMNFYGFTKTKVGTIGNQSMWQFAHPKFIRGQKRLLVDIKRRTYAGDQQLDLAEELTTLREKLAAAEKRADFWETECMRYRQQQEEEEGEGIQGEENFADISM